MQANTHPWPPQPSSIVTSNSRLSLALLRIAHVTRVIARCFEQDCSNGSPEADTRGSTADAGPSSIRLGRRNRRSFLFAGGHEWLRACFVACCRPATGRSLPTEVCEHSEGASRGGTLGFWLLPDAIWFCLTSNWIGVQPQTWVSEYEFTLDASGIRLRVSVTNNTMHPNIRRYCNGIKRIVAMSAQRDIFTLYIRTIQSILQSSFSSSAFLVGAGNLDPPQTSKWSAQLISERKHSPRHAN